MDISRVNKGVVFNNPLSLLPYIDDSNTLTYLNSFIPYSTGFEIECFASDHYDADILKNIPFIMDYNGGGSEFRFRIPSGFAGIICLYFIADEIKTHLTFNNLSGIHYHVDCKTDKSFNFIANSNVAQKQFDWTIKRLAKWKYKGTYNTMAISCDRNTGGFTVTKDHINDYGNYSTWLKFNNEYNTAEFRLGEMTFDYSLLLRRIMDVNFIIKRWKHDTINRPIEVKHSKIDIQKIIDFLSIERKSVKNDITSDSRFSNFNPSMIMTGMQDLLDIMNEKVKSRNVTVNEFFD